MAFLRWEFLVIATVTLWAVWSVTTEPHPNRAETSSFEPSASTRPLSAPPVVARTDTER